MRQRNAALGHHFDQIARTQFVADIPPHAQDDDLAFKLAPLNIFETRMGPVADAIIAVPRQFPHFAPEPYCLKKPGILTAARHVASATFCAW